MFDIHQVANSLSMLPFIYLSCAVGPWPLAISITSMWVSALVYHLYMAISDFPIAFRWFVADIFSQFITLWITGTLSNCFPLHIKRGWTIAGAFAFAALVFYTLNEPHTINQPCIQQKLIMKYIVCATHIALASLGAFFACDYNAYYTAMALLLAIAFTFYIDECGVTFVWSLGHVLCAAYTYYTWKAHGLITL